MATKLKVKNGVCEHNKMLLNCDVCYPQFQLEENKRWLDKQKAIREEYEGWRESYNRYISICGNPIQNESFH